MTVLMILRTRSVLNDERVLKEAATIAELGSCVEIFASESANKRANSSFSGQVNLLSQNLWSARFLGRLSVVELNCRAVARTVNARVRGRKFEIVWLHDPVMFLGLPIWLLLRALGVVSKIVWDHHELPPAKYVQSPGWRWLLGRLALSVDINIQANEPRKAYFVDCFVSSDRHRARLDEKTLVLRNYPARQEGAITLPDEIRDQLPKEPFVYVQSGFGSHRNFASLAQALSQFEDLPVVFAGVSPAEAADYFARANWIALGRVAPAYLPALFQHAQFTIILYQQSFGINNWLCEPNRLFHALSHACPVIAGNNPPMKAFLESTGGGVILDDDGSDVAGLVERIQAVRQASDTFKIIYPEGGYWESQKDTIASAIVDSA
jgi:hypothetical protein